MTRRQFHSLGAGLLLKRVASSQPAARPKNVLLIMADQHKPGALGVEGDPVARTPNLDALARSGTRFSRAYCANPVCVPSRASLLTGLYTHNHRAYNNATPWPFEHKTIAHAFSRAGYLTALIGKMHFVDAQTHGFDYHLGFNDWFQYLGPKTRLYADELSKPDSGSGLPEVDDLWEDADAWAGHRETDDRQGLNHVGKVSQIPEPDHFESFVARESIRFLRNHGQKQPFFLLASFLKPHNPFMPAERFARLFRPEDMRLPSTWGKVNLATVPAEIRRRIEQDRATPELKDPAQARRRIAFYYANLAQMDDCAGRLLRALDELGLANDTLVLYTSDHGDMLGEHGLWAKFVMYESSVRVPLLFRVSGLTFAGSRSLTPVSLVQVFATLAEVCGLAAPSNLDGPSLLADLREPSRTRETTVYAEHAQRTPRARYMVRHGDFKYCYWVKDMPELYNLRDDPEEMRNLALLPAFQVKADEMRSRLFAWYQPPEAA